MATGYTAIIEEDPNVTFEQFMLRCSRAFGATIMQRDEAMDVAPRHREPSTFYVEWLREAKSDFAKYEAMSNEDAKVHADREYLDAVKRQRDRNTQATELRERYTAMLNQVLDWEPPTDGHVGLKMFMYEQITETIKRDTRPYDDEIKRETAGEWRSRKIRDARERIDRYKEQIVEEAERCGGSNEWIDALTAEVDAKSA